MTTVITSTEAETISVLVYDKAGRETLTCVMRCTSLFRECTGEYTVSYHGDHVGKIYADRVKLPDRLFVQVGDRWTSVWQGDSQ